VREVTLKVTLYGVDKWRQPDSAVDRCRASTRPSTRAAMWVDVVRRTTDQKVGGSTPSERAEFVQVRASRLVRTGAGRRS
jgi:hypothetical protein